MYEIIIWGYLPAVLGLIFLLISLFVTFRQPDIINIIFTAFIATFVIIAEFLLLETFNYNAYPTYVPHILIGVGMVLIIGQIYYRLKIFK